MTIWSIAFSLFLLMDPIGNIPLYVSFLKELPEKRQRWIIFRELLIALFIIYLFTFLGDGLMSFLEIEESAIHIAGGIILFLIALRMIFPTPKNTTFESSEKSEPFIVPLAVPLVAGPSVLAAVIIYTNQETSELKMLIAVSIAWAISLCILLLSPLINRMLGSRGISAAEKLMGLILILISIQMLLSGISCFIESHR